MAVKKKKKTTGSSKKSPAKTGRTTSSKSVGAIVFPTITDDMTDEAKLEALGKSSELLMTIQKNIAMTTPIDCKPVELAIAVNKMLLIDKKVIYVGSEINKLTRLIGHKKEKAKLESEATQAETTPSEVAEETKLN